MDIFKTLIITDAILPKITMLAEAYTPSPALAVTAPLSASGAAPATHWGASGHVPADFVALWQLDAAGFQAGAAAFGATLSLQDAQDILDGSNMQDAIVWDVLAAMDLKMVVEDEQLIG